MVLLVKKLLNSVQANARLFLSASRYSTGKHLNTGTLACAEISVKKSVLE